MIRAVFLFLVIAALAAGAAWLADHPGQMTLTWGEWRVDTSAAVLVALMAVLGAVMALLYRFWLFLRRAPGQIGQSWKRGRVDRGQKALAHGMVAVAAGDGKEAAKLAKRAEGLLGRGELTLLLQAQAAQMAGDEKAAETFFTLMIEDEDTAFLGLRGLINQAMARGDHDAAIELAQRARDLRPHSEWVAETLFSLQTRVGAWDGARVALKDESKVKKMTRGEARRRDAALLHQQSLEADTPQQALKLAKQAFAESQAFLPAAIRYASLSAASGHHRKAVSVVEATWAVLPHPDLLEPYFTAKKADDAMARIKAAQHLARINADAVESNLVIAEYALQARLWGEARAALLNLSNAGTATRLAYQLLAQLEQAEHDDGAAANAWLMRAASADPDPAWVCGACGHVETAWTIRCPKCAGFDTYDWDTPAHVALLEAPDAP